LRKKWILRKIYPKLRKKYAIPLKTKAFLLRPLLVPAFVTSIDVLAAEI
jgi:hypothetical protein